MNRRSLFGFALAAAAPNAHASDPGSDLIAALNRVAQSNYPRYLVIAEMTDGSDPAQYNCHWESEIPLAVAWLRHNYQGCGRITAQDVWSGKAEQVG